MRLTPLAQICLTDYLRMQSGLESLERGEFSSNDALNFSVIHNQTVGKPIQRTPRDVIMQDGNESIMGTLKEWSAAASKALGGFFKDYDGKELARIEKEVKGGLSAYKGASIKDALIGVENVRRITVERFDKMYPRIKDKPLFKGLDQKEAKEKLLHEIDKTINGMKNSKMEDFYMSQIKKNAEKYMVKIIAKIRDLKQTHVKFKALIEKEYIYEYLMTCGYNPNTLEMLRKGGDTIIRKLEMIDKNGVVLLDIIKSKIFVDLEEYIKAVFTFSDKLFGDMKKSYDYISDLDEKDVITLNKKEFTVAEMRKITIMGSMYLDAVMGSVASLSHEVANSITMTSVTLTGLPEYIAEFYL